MKFKNQIMSALGAVILLTSVQQARATSFILNDFVMTVDSGGTLTGLQELRFGFFAAGFTPTASNASSWFSNFTGVSGYFDPSGPEWSAGIDIGDNLTYPVNTSLVAIVFNVADDTPLTPSLLANSSTKGAIITNSAWKISAAQSADFTQWYVDQDGIYKDTDIPLNRTAGTTTALVGTFSGGSVGLTAVPEPSTGALMMIGAAGLVALRRLRKV